MLSLIENMSFGLIIEFDSEESDAQSVSSDSENSNEHRQLADVWLSLVENMSESMVVVLRCVVCISVSSTWSPCGMMLTVFS